MKKLLLYHISFSFMYILLLNLKEIHKNINFKNVKINVTKILLFPLNNIIEVMPSINIFTNNITIIGKMSNKYVLIFPTYFISNKITIISNK